MFLRELGMAAGRAGVAFPLRQVRWGMRKTRREGTVHQRSGWRGRSWMKAAQCALTILMMVTAGGDARAQFTNFPPPPTRSDPAPTPPAGGGSNDRTALYIIGGVVLGIIGAAIIAKIWGNRTPPDQPPQTPPEDQLAQLPPEPEVTPPPRPTGQASTAPPRRGFDLPPVGEARFVPDEVMLDSDLSDPILAAIAARNGLVRIESARIALTGRTLHRWRFGRGGSVRDVIRELSREQQLAGAQPIYLYNLTQATNLTNEQYAPAKLNIINAHNLATGKQVTVALIDSAVDARHPDLAGAVAANFKAVNDNSPAHAHGTAMAGAIAARRTMLSVAPHGRLITVEAFSSKETSAEGTSLNILKGLDWAAAQGARIVNMSFAGPADPRLRAALSAAANKGMVLIAATGNAGPRSPPLYPAADPNVIAVTATDIKNALFRNAVRGKHVAVAAPGVEVLVPAPDGSYQLSTGTSVAAAEVSGVAALMIERNPRLTGKDVRAILMRTAKDLGAKGHDREFGAGLVDAYEAVAAAGGGAVATASPVRQ